MASDPSPRPDVSRDRVVAAVRDAPRPVVNTEYLQGRLDLPFEEVYVRLARLADEGVLEHHELRGFGHLWWLSTEAELSE